jgi:hypothetical protein
MDGLVHNMYDPRNPDNLLYQYERFFSSIPKDYVDGRRGKPDGEFRTLTLGGGGVFFPPIWSEPIPSGFTR